jgi:calcineurin-like phosphoesterase family protein
VSVLFTSDTHYSHRNIIKYCGRPFLTDDGQPDLHAMHRTMSERWNETVGPRDTVYHLGDFAMAKNVGGIAGYRKKLQGKVILIRGNHDRSAQQMLLAGFDEVHDRLELELDGYKLYLSHIPLKDDDSGRKYRPEFRQKPPPYYDYWLCGHVHEKWRRRGKVINVGVDQWGFTPRSLEEILAAPEDSWAAACSRT